MVLTMLYYMHDMESLMGKTAIKIGQNRVAATLIAIDAVCWGALLFFGIHYFTCQENVKMIGEFATMVALGFLIGMIVGMALS